MPMARSANAISPYGAAVVAFVPDITARPGLEGDVGLIVRAHWATHYDGQIGYQSTHLCYKSLYFGYFRFTL